MKAQTFTPQGYEFYFADLDTLVFVEHSSDEVIIRATRDTFSTQRKEAFIHELAAEGFIGDDYRWFSPSSNYQVHHVRWLVDYSWLETNAEINASTRRSVLRMLGYAMVLWLVMMSILVLRWPG